MAKPAAAEQQHSKQIQLFRHLFRMKLLSQAFAAQVAHGT